MPGARLKPLPVPLRRSREAIGTIAVGAAMVLALVAVFPLLRQPHVVPRVTLVNTTVFQLNVQATGDADGTWLDLGSVPREGEVSAEDVIDQGRNWTFRFSSAGIFGAEMTLSRADLEHDHWRVNVPAGVAVPLQEAGLPPSAS